MRRMAQAAGIFFALASVIPAFPAVTTVCASGCAAADFQQAINAAKPGDTLILKAGETYRGNFFLPWKEGNGYITIQSSMVDQLPPRGHRIGPEHTKFMPLLQQQHRGIQVLGAGSSQYEVTKVDPATDRIYFSDRLAIPQNEPVMCRGQNLAAPLKPYQTYYAREVDGVSMILADSANGPRIDLTSAATAFVCTNLRTAHHYRLRGIEFAAVDGQTSEYVLVIIGTGAEMTRGAVPRNVEFEQVYIHGHSSREKYQNGPRTCLVMNGAYLSIRDSYIAECKKEGEESKAIGAWQAPGPLEIRNNYIEAASINVVFGGSATPIVGHVVGDGDGVRNGGVVIAHNHFSKQLYWKYEAGPGVDRTPSGRCQAYTYTLDAGRGKLYQCTGDGQWEATPACAEGEYYRRTDVPQNCAEGACWSCSSGVYRKVSSPYRGSSYVVKAILEAKSMRNGRIFGNILENSWSTPVALPMQVENPGYNWNRGEDIVFRDNVVRNSSSGYHLGTEGAAKFTHPNREIHLVNNLFHSIGRTDTPTLEYVPVRPLVFQGTCINCSFEHNTILSGQTDGTAVIFGRDPFVNFRFANNIAHSNLYGIFGEGRSPGCDAIEYYTGKSAFQNNIFINNTKALRNGSLGSCVKNTRYVPADRPLFAGEGTYRLRPDSPYSASCTVRCEYAATDGTDLGADIDLIDAATSGVLEGVPTWAERLKLDVKPAENKAILSYVAPGTDACTVRLFTNPGRTVPHADTATLERQSDSQSGSASRTRQFVLGANSALEPDTLYWYLLRCQNWRVPGQFQTLRPAAKGR